MNAIFRHPIRLLIAIVAVLVILTQTLAIVPEDKQALILRFELARSVSEVASLLGAPDTPQGQHLRATLNLINTTDFAFALAYPLLNVAMVAFVAAGRTRAFRLVAVALALAMSVGDICENRALIALASAASPDPEQVRGLQIATSVKWGALYVCAGVLGTALLQGGLLRRMLDHIEKEHA